MRDTTTAVASTQRAINHHIDHYAENPKAHAKALRGLGVPMKVVQHAHKELAPKPRKVFGKQVEASSPSGQQILHAATKGWKPPSAGPFASPADAARARTEAQFHSPQTLGGLGRRTTELVTGVDPLHPLRNELFGSGVANLGLGVIGSVPIVRGPRLLAREVRAARAVRRLEKGTETARAYKPRTLKHGELEQQIPKSRSRIARVGEKVADKTSGRLQRSDRARKTILVKHLTTEQRVTKAAGRAQRVEGSRAQAAMAQHIRVLDKVKAGSPEDVSHFWYAQLPKSHRNAEGLKLVHAKQSAHLEDLLSGKFARSLDKQAAAAQAERRNVEFGTPEWTRLANQIEHIGNIKADLPRRIQDTSASIANLDRVIARAPAVHQEVVDAMHALSKERKRILVESKRLKPEKAAGRTGIVSRWVGLEPTGEEAYVGHRLPAPKGRTGPSAPSAGVGRVRSPKGTGTKNRLVLAETGRLRPSVHVAAEDWHHAQIFEQANKARSDLSKMAEPYRGHVPEGHVLLNPKGRTVPAHWRSDELAQFGEGWGDVAAIRSQAEEIVKGFTARADDPEAIEALKRAADAAGVKRSELRVMHEDLVNRYYKQFRRMAPPRGKGAKAIDAMTDAVATSIIFARVGYIPKNVVQNVVMALPHQGVLFPRNVARAAQALADPELRTLLKAEVGFSGASRELGAELSTTQKLGRVPHAVAGASGAVADDLFRVSAFMHEAAAEKVISKNPLTLLTDKDRGALLELLKDKSQRPLLNDVRSHSTEAMADFSRLTPDQARLARRFVVIPSWLMAGSRYPIHFAANHPIRSALLAYVAMGEPGAPDYLHFNKPADKYFTKGVAPWLQGIKVPGGKVLRTGSISPVSTPWEIAQAGVQTVRGKQPFDFSKQTVADYAAPFPSAAYEALSGGGVKSLERLAPGEKFVRQMVSPDESSKYYPDDKTRLGRFQRELGVVPIHVAETGDRVADNYRKFHAELQANLHAIGLKEIPKEVQGRIALSYDRAQARAKLGKDPTPLQKFGSDVKLVRSHGWVTAEQAREAMRWARTAPAADISNALGNLTRNFFDHDGVLSLSLGYANELNTYNSDLQALVTAGRISRQKAQALRKSAMTSDLDVIRDAVRQIRATNSSIRFPDTKPLKIPH
jgi:hypothetical protein